MSFYSLSQNAVFKTFRKPVSREAEALLAGAVVGVALLTLAQSHDMSESAEMPSEATIESSEPASQDEQKWVRRRY